jgi:hypothetical protein
MGGNEGDREKRVRLLSKLERKIRSHQDWWTFDPEGCVKGFCGPGPIVIVGDQPSTSEWRSGHPNRLLFYGTLESLNIGGAHLTDVIKRRGKASASAKQLPSDFDRHLAILPREFRIVSPVRIIALGELAERWLRRYFPDCENKLCGIIHFAAKPNGRTPDVATEFKRQMRFAVDSPESELRYVRARPHVKYSLSGVPKKTMRVQMDVLYQILLSATADRRGEFSEPQVMKLVWAAAGRGELVTKQPPWRIWTYYVPWFVDGGLLRERTDPTKGISWSEPPEMAGRSGGV